MKPIPFSILRKSSAAQKKIFWGSVAALACVLLYAWGILPLVEARNRAEEEIALKKRLLLKYDEFLAGRPVLLEQLERVRRRFEEAERRLLPGETTQLAAANLQDVVRKLSEKNGVALRSFRILESKESGLYRKISLQIELNPVGSMSNLAQFLKEIENYERDLVISEMDLLVFNPRMPSQIQGSLVISGFIKGSKGREKGKEGP